MTGLLGIAGTWRFGLQMDLQIGNSVGTLAVLRARRAAGCLFVQCLVERQ